MGAPGKNRTCCLLLANGRLGVLWLPSGGWGMASDRPRWWSLRSPTALPRPPMRGTAATVAELLTVEARPHGLCRWFAPRDRPTPISWRSTQAFEVTTRHDECRRPRQPFADPSFSLLLVADAPQYPFDKRHRRITEAPSNRDSVIPRQQRRGPGHHSGPHTRRLKGG